MPWTAGAITRRRAIQSADALLRLIFAYASNDGFLRRTAAWASTIQRPGSPGTTGRLHAPWNLATGCWEQLALTDAHGAESLTRLRLRPPEVVRGDRHDAKPRAPAHVIAPGADVGVRVGGMRCGGKPGTATPGRSCTPCGRCPRPRRATGRCRSRAPPAGAH